MSPPPPPPPESQINPPYETEEIRRIVEDLQRPYLIITTQPEPEHRFRYRTEGNTAPLQGANSTPRNKMYPTVQFHGGRINYRIIIKCELFTADNKLHVHQIENNKVDVHPPCFTAEFRNLVVVRTRKENWQNILEQKKQNYGGGYDMEEVKRELRDMDPEKIKLGFWACALNADQSVGNRLTDTVFSEIIVSGLPKINQMSTSRGSCQGGEELWLVVDNIKPRLTKVRFFNGTDWFKDIDRSDAGFQILHQHVIILRTPPYRQVNYEESVYIQLFSNQRASHAKIFTYTPINWQEQQQLPATWGHSDYYVADHSQQKYLPNTEGFPEKGENEDYINLSSEAYRKIETIWGSDDPNRLQDIKEILCAKGKKMGPLQAAVYYNQYETLKNLVVFIKDKIKLKQLIATKDDSGRTPLMLAIDHGKGDCESFLMEAGVNAVPQGILKEDQRKPEKVDEDDKEDSSTSDDEDVDSSASDEEDCDCSAFDEGVKAVDESYSDEQNRFENEKGKAIYAVGDVACYSQLADNQIKVEYSQPDESKLTERLKNVKIQ